MLEPAEVAATGAWIASVQLPDGMIPWYPGGHADPWNHVEAAMALVVSGHPREAERALRWLAGRQHPDGSWCHYYLADGIEDPRRDPNACAYLAAGVWWHHLVTGRRALMEEMWPTLQRAVDFVVGLQRPGGEVAWSLDADGIPGDFALLTSCSSILHSLRCAVAVAEAVGEERPDWELAAARLAGALRHRPDAFADKGRWAMDWYYPVLSGAVAGEEARNRLREGWGTFAEASLGIRCVSDQRWVTAAETAECAMACHAAGLGELASALAGATRHLRDDDGAYWTGCVHPQCVRYPGGERSTYSAAAVVLADHVLAGRSAASGFFGDSVPALVELGEVEGSPRP